MTRPRCATWPAPAPDHDTLATFRTQFADLLPDVFRQRLRAAVAAGVLQFGPLVLAGDGAKIRADASKRKAVSYGRLDARQPREHGEIAALLACGAAAAAAPLPAGLVSDGASNWRSTYCRMPPWR